MPRAAAWAKRVILLAEPTAALGVVQTKGVLDQIRREAMYRATETTIEEMVGAMIGAVTQENQS